MVCQLVGYIDKEREVRDNNNNPTGEIVPVKVLCFVRKPKFTESAVGHITVRCNVKGIDRISKLPPLEIDASYDCTFGNFQGYDMLEDITKLKS